MDVYYLNPPLAWPLIGTEHLKPCSDNRILAESRSKTIKFMGLADLEVCEQIKVGPLKRFRVNDSKCL